MPMLRCKSLLFCLIVVSFGGLALAGRNHVLAQSTRPDATSEQPQLAQMQDSRVSLSVYVDRKKNNEIIQENADFAVVVYEMSNREGATTIRPVARSQSRNRKQIDIMSKWKGSGEISIDYASLYETVYPPLFLTLELINNSGQPVQISNGYLDVEQSAMDPQPFITLRPVVEACVDKAKLEPVLRFRNLGWGPVQNARITYSFAKQFPSGNSGIVDSFRMKPVSFEDSTNLSLMEGLSDVNADIPRLRAGVFNCSSSANLPACKSNLAKAGVFGRIPADSIHGSEESESSLIQFAWVSGSVEYDWVDADGTIRKTRSRFQSEFPMFTFTVPDAAECAAGEPEDRDHKPLKLSLDRADYRVPIRINETLRPGAVKRLALNLSAEKSSRHRFRVVLRSTDGIFLVSNKFDFLFFKPKLETVAAGAQ
jgi:hypothetical protein